MADPTGALVVSGGGTTRVGTDTLLAQAAMLRVLHGHALDWQARLVRIRRLDSRPRVIWNGTVESSEIFTLTRTIDRIECESADLSDGLLVAAGGYGAAERRIELAARLSGAWSAHALGALSPLLAALAVPALSAGVLAWLFAAPLAGTEPGDPATLLRELIAKNPRLLTNPVFVQFVRVLVSSVDDAAAGATGVPFPVSVALGDEGVGVLGAATSAIGVLGLARPLGLLRESPVTVTRARAPRPVSPPTGVADLAARIPSASPEGPQVRIERYEPGLSRTKPAWVVYIGGTVDWDPAGASEPWDITSNVTAIAEQGSGSHRAVVQALREAGVQPGDPVVQVGHSQGGLIAARVAASGDFNTVALATFGAPAGQVPVPDAVPMIATEHSDDVIPALGGTPRDTTNAGNAHLVVRREAYAVDAIPTGEALPTHNIAAYRDTARLIDESPEPRLIAFRSTVRAVVGQGAGQVTFWRGDRVT